MEKYSQKTRFLQIPVRRSGESIKTHVELEKWQRLEDIMLGAVKGVRNCSYMEGDIEIIKNNGKVSVILSRKPESPAFEGMARGKYIVVSSAIIWEDIGSSNFAYLWIAPSVCGSTEKCFNYSRPCSTKEDSVLIGVVDIEKLTIDRMPPGKLVSSNLVAHLQDNKNPHGEELVQSSIISDKIMTSELFISGEKIMPSQKRTNDVALNGSDGVEVSFDFVVNFASWCGLDSSVKNVWFGFYGVDSRVTNPNNLMVYSDKGIVSKIRLMVW